MAVERPNRGWVRFLTVLVGILTVIAILTTWADRQLFDTQEWGDTSLEMLQNKEIQTQVADYAVSELYNNVDVDAELKSVLPGDLKSLSGPAAGGLRQVAGEGAQRALSDPRIQSLWQTANETAHKTLINILENKSSVVDTADGNVTLDLRPLIVEIADQVGLGNTIGDKIPQDVGTVEIIKSSELSTAQTVTSVIKGTALIATALLLLLMALAIYLSKGYRWLTLLNLAIALIIGAVIILILRSIAGGLVVNQLATPDVQPAAQAAYGIGTGLLKSIAWSIIWASLALIVISWLLSPNKAATSTRSYLAVPVGRYPAAYGVLVGLVLFFWLLMGVGSGRSFIIRLLIVALIGVGAHVLRHRPVAESPDANPDRAGDFSTPMTEKVNKAWDNRPRNISMPKMPSGGGGGPPADAETKRLDYLERLAALREKGVLSDEEFQAEKTRVFSEGERSSGS